jgi:hypothetical protein
MKSLILITILCASFYSISQDTLFFKNNEVIPALVVQINFDDIVYKKISNLDGPDYKAYKADVKYIRYRNGGIENMDSMYSVNSNEIMAKSLSPSVINGVYEKSEKMFIKGKRDAKLFYDGPTGAVGVGITSFFILPIGLIPAIICSAIAPREKNLNYPNYDLWKNEGYQAGYKYQAKKVKQKKIWTGFGIGLAAGILFRTFTSNTR